MTTKGFVTLVGAGPGDPGLMTLAGREALEKADVVLYDRLIGEGVLAMLPANATAIDVGKSKGDHPVPQEEINRLLLEHAREGRRVVRLKGGDPFLFGRGGEELVLLAEQGIPFRVVPGVTSAMAAPACAGIPVTHRGHSSSVHILTGHGKNGEPPDLPYPELARLKGTLVFLMALTTAGAIRDGLVNAGMPPDTPAAVIENGTRGNQRRIATTLADLPEAAKGCVSPAVLVVGTVCSLADAFDWTARSPLAGARALVVSSRATASRLAVLLRDQGCAADEFAGIATERASTPDSLWARLREYGWVALSSEFGVDTFFAKMAGRRLDVRSLAPVKFAAVGKRTAGALARHGVFADFVPAKFDGAHLGEGLARLVRRGERVLVFCAEDAGRDMPDALRARGVDFDVVAAYRTIRRAPPPEMLATVRAGGYDFLTFASASSVEALAGALPGMDWSRIAAFCIGEVTAAAATRRGMHAAVAREASLEAMVAMIVERKGRQ